MSSCAPFIKWVGGKRRVIPELQKRLPEKFNRYFEPFIGGGAFLFHLNRKNSFISDLNSELINLYRVVKDSVDELMEDLELHENSSEYYYNIRNLDRDRESYKKLSDIEKASRFIYLNKSCFNGLYRVNRKGEFNVPFGKYKSPIYFERENLLKCSRFLQGVEIEQGDFTTYRQEIEREDFVYFDPPYFPITDTSNFTSYTKDGFGIDEQTRLLEFLREIDGKGAFFMLSNSYSEFTIDFYKEFNIDTIGVGRSINSRGDKRGKVKEIIVRNY
jgi:DNA adenine methylase